MHERNEMRISTTTVLLVTCSTLSCLGHGILIFDQDAEAGARGNAFTATADNPSAVYYNPAGITQLPSHQVRVGLYSLTYQMRLRSPSGADVDSKRAYEATPNLYYTYSLPEKPISFGLGVYAPFGLSMKWPENSGFRSVAREGRVTYLTLQPVVAWRVNPTLSVAAGPTFNFGQTELKQGLSPLAGNDSFQFKGDAFAPGFTAGILWQPLEKHSFGVTYRSATTMDFDGHTDTASVTPAFSLRQDARVKFEFPQSVTLGWSFRPTINWNFEFDANWTDWSSFGAVPIRQATPVPPLILNWQSSWYFAWGVTRKFGDGWHASAGYIFSENSVPDAHFTPLVPDTDRHAWSIGIGRETAKWTWDVAYQLTWGSPRTVNGSALSPAGQSADGRYEWWSHALSVSVGRKF
jgi:long-chain fatty acid transport protein